MEGAASLSGGFRSVVLNTPLCSLSVGIGFEATAKRPNRCELRGHLAIAPLYSAMEALARASIRGPYSTEDSGF